MDERFLLDDHFFIHRRMCDLNWLEPRFAKIRELTTGQEYSGNAAGGGIGFGMGGSKRMVYPVQIKPHSYRVFAVMDSRTST